MYIAMIVFRKDSGVAPHFEFNCPSPRLAIKQG